MTELWKEPAEIVGIVQEGVCFARHTTESGFVLENGTVLSEEEKDTNGFYIGGAGMDGIYLRTPERYASIRDEAGKLTGFRHISQYVSFFNTTELELIYSYATSPEENLPQELRAAGNRLERTPEVQTLFISTAEKLEQIPPSQHRRLVSDVYAVWRGRNMEDLRSRHQTAKHTSMAEQLTRAAKETAEVNANRNAVRATVTEQNEI